MRALTGVWKWIVIAITGMAVTFIVFTSLWRPFHPALQGAVVLTFGMLVVFINYPISKSALARNPSGSAAMLLYGSGNAPSLLDILFTVLGTAPCIFIIFNWEPIVSNPLSYETYHLVLGAVLVLGWLLTMRGIPRLVVRLGRRGHELGDRRVTSDGIVVIKAQNSRSQARNRQAALERLAELIRAASRVDPPRIPTRPGAKAKALRVEDKRHRSKVKAQRGRVRDD